MGPLWERIKEQEMSFFTNLDGLILPSSGINSASAKAILFLRPQAMVRAALVVMKQIVAVMTVVVEVVVET